MVIVVVFSATGFCDLKYSVPLIGTLYEERQVEKNDKEGLALDATLDLVKKMLFMYRKEKF